MSTRPARSTARAERVIFTDLDGTLLDGDTYRPTQQARALVLGLAASGVAVIPVTSKTAAEVAPLAGDLGLEGPFIAEGGAVIVDFDGGERVLGCPRAELVRVLDDLRELGLPVRGMSEMSVPEIAERTGLGHAAAERATTRSASEPFITERSLTDDEVRMLHDETARRGLGLTRGGRFWHLAGAGIDKGSAVRALLQSWPPGCRPRTAGVGDAWNDVPMLTAVDLGFLLGHAVAPDEVPPGVVRLSVTGPEGFVEAVTRVCGSWGVDLAQECASRPRG